LKLEGLEETPALSPLRETTSTKRRFRRKEARKGLKEAQNEKDREQG